MTDRELVPDVIVALGIACLVVGVGLWSFAAAMVVLGLILMALGAAWMLGGEHDEDSEEDEE